MKNRAKLILLVLTSGAVLLSAQVMATDVPIKITGSVYIPPCKINQGVVLNIPFGKILLQKVDGRNYARSTTVNVSCTYSHGKPYISLYGGTGQLSGAPDNVLKTTGANPSTLGVALYQGGEVDIRNPLRLGTGEQGKYGYELRKGLSAVNNQNSQFTFTAVPYKHGHSELNAGTFRASATMTISYL